MKLRVATTHFICCHAEASECPHTRECANHATAGDFRSEGGPTPKLVVLSENEGECEGPYEGHRGYLKYDKKTKRYSVSGYPYDEDTPLPRHGRRPERELNQNVLRKIVVERNEDGRIQEPGFYFEGSDNPFCPDEFRPGTPTRMALDAIFSLVVGYNEIAEKEEEE